LDSNTEASEKGTSTLSLLAIIVLPALGLRLGSFGMVVGSNRSRPTDGAVVGIRIAEVKRVGREA